MTPTAACEILEEYFAKVWRVLGVHMTWTGWEIGFERWSGRNQEHCRSVLWFSEGYFDNIRPRWLCRVVEEMLDEFYDLENEHLFDLKPDVEIDWGEE